MRRCGEHSMNNQLSQSVLRRLAKERWMLYFVQLFCSPVLLFLWTLLLVIANVSVQVLLEKFQTASFAELCSITMANKPAESLYHCLNDIYGRFAKSFLVTL